VVTLTVAMTMMLAASLSVASSTPRTLTTAAQAQDVGAVYFLTPRVGWASVGNSARLLMTTDAGAHWRDVSPPMLKKKVVALANGVAGADFLSPSDFFVSVYESGSAEYVPVFLLHTTDSGRKWTEVGSFPRGAGTAWASFQNDRQGWVAVGNGAAGGAFTVTIYETTNGGAHWVMVSRSMSLGGTPGTPDDPSGCGDTGLVAQGTMRAPVLWLTGYRAIAPCVMESTDGGRRWGQARLPGTSAATGGEAWPPVFSSESKGALAAWYGTDHGGVMAIYSTTNAGKTWAEHGSPAAAPALVAVVSATTWFAAIDRTVYRTTDGGTSWSTVRGSLNFGGTQASNTLDFVNTVDGWAVRAGTLWHTTDGGHMWASEVLPT
jgi:photosystem II stability/assembly factor-like uncharacterized protein